MNARRLLSPLGWLLLRLDPWLYPVWAAIQTIASARLFYGYMLKQTGGEWSGPLDDVFIHFDYARSTAQGHPFEWVVGNGYSSGNTSLSYPFVLALGWLLGFRDSELMVWAALIAMVCVFGTLLAARRLFFVNGDDGWQRASSYLLPPSLLCVGALDWSLWSGMEVALYMGVWSLALVAFLHAREQAGAGPSRALARRAWLLGAAGALLFVTRPEAVGTIATFGLAIALPIARRRPWAALALLARTGLPAALMLALQLGANHIFTGEVSANGAIVKLALNNPFMTPEEKLADYRFNLGYAVFRNIEYHFSSPLAPDGLLRGLLPEALREAGAGRALASGTGWGAVLLFLALVPLALRRTRAMAVVLWAQIAAWLLLVAANGQVRWQNERYTMPAVAWLLILAALGASALGRRKERPGVPWLLASVVLVVQIVGVITRPPGALPEIRVPWLLALALGLGAALALRVFAVRALCAAALVFLAQQHLETKMRDQKWFFGRASRNIRDQHLTLGRWLAPQRVSRVLVGDAGAILYASDKRGLDIIGLGGFRDLPFARAGLHGMPATIELIERMAPDDRPDILAIFPTWWGSFPTWFGPEMVRRFPAPGNVICGGYEHVVYRADWHVLGTGARPRSLDGGEIRDELDVADLVSEKRHDYRFTRPQNGWTEMKILPDPLNARRDMFDAGRRIGPGKSESFVLRNAILGRAGTLLFRSAPDGRASIRILVDGVEIAKEAFVHHNGWIERAVPIPPGRVTRERLPVEIRSEGPGDWVDYHVWFAQ